MKDGIVIAGFAGVGKTTLAKKYKNVIDIESSPYRWDYTNVDTTNLESLKGTKDRIKNANFPENYINAIKEAKKKYDVILVWLHPEEILPYYEANNIDYYLCFPNKEALKEYEDRYITRGNNQDYIHKVLSSYEKRYSQFKLNPHKHIELSLGETLETALIKMEIKLEK